MTNIISIGATGKHSDFRVLVWDYMEKYPEVKDGILILFDETEGMLVRFVCKQSFLAWAGADLIHKSASGDTEPV